MDTAERSRRGRLLYVALAFLGLDLPPAAHPSGLRALHTWLDTWHGIGLIAHGLALRCSRRECGMTLHSRPSKDHIIPLVNFTTRWEPGLPSPPQGPHRPRAVVE
jgi:hypothetical protein